VPSVYELLPHPLTDRSVDPSGKDLNLDLYDVTTWKRMQWSVFDYRHRASGGAGFGNEKCVVR
jgi:hypothetical protein